jgi:ADP-heptose:LPS heptosyltransferase
MRFLVTRLRFLGDIVLSTPLLEILRERFPDASIEYLAMEPHARVLESHPAVDRLHVLPARPGPGDLLRVVRDLRSGPRIDWAFDLYSNPRSAILVALSGARQRVGSDRGLRARVYQHRRVRPPGERSAIRHHLDKLVPLLGHLPEPRPVRLVVDEQRAQAVLGSLGISPGQYTLIHPGSSWPDKAWPEERWGQLMRGLDRDRSGELLVVCGPGEAEMSGRVADAGQARLLPPLDVSALSSILQRARLYVGNDGGVMHMAVAHAVPTVALFGPTEPDIWFPYEQWGPFRVLHACGPERLDEDGNKLSRLGPISVADVDSMIDEVLMASKRTGTR